MWRRGLALRPAGFMVLKVVGSCTWGLYRASIWGLYRVFYACYIGFIWGSAVWQPTTPAWDPSLSVPVIIHHGTNGLPAIAWPVRRIKVQFLKTSSMELSTPCKVLGPPPTVFDTKPKVSQSCALNPKRARLRGNPNP